MIGASFLLAYCGLSGLAATQARHRRELLQVSTAAAPVLLRIGASAVLALSLWLCISFWPVDEGIVAWVMLLAIAGATVVGVLAFAAGWFWWLLAAAAIGSVALLSI